MSYHELVEKLQFELCKRDGGMSVGPYEHEMARRFEKVVRAWLEEKAHQIHRIEREGYTGREVRQILGLSPSKNHSVQKNDMVCECGTEGCTMHRPLTQKPGMWDGALEDMKKFNPHFGHPTSNGICLTCKPQEPVSGCECKCLTTGKECVCSLMAPQAVKPKEAPMEQVKWCEHIIKGVNGGWYFKVRENFFNDECMDEYRLVNEWEKCICGAPRPEPRKALAERLFETFRSCKVNDDAWSIVANAALDAVLEVVNDYFKQFHAEKMWDELKKRLESLRG